MAKDSCIVHQKEYHICIYRDFIELVNGDLCAAAILWKLEYATKGEIDRMRLAEETGDPWVKASLNTIMYDLLGAFSDKTLRRRLACLKDLGIITVQADGRGTVNQYLFNREFVSEALRTRKIFRLSSVTVTYEETDEENLQDSLPSVTPSVSTSVSLTDGVTEVEGVYIGRRTENLELKAAAVDAALFEEGFSLDIEELYLEDNIDEFIFNSSRKLPAKLKFRRPAIKKDWYPLESSYGKEDLRRGWMVYLGWLKTNGKTIRDAQAYFISAVDRFLGMIPDPPSTPLEPLTTGGVSPIRPGSSNGLKEFSSSGTVLNAGQLPEHALRWNSVVQDPPVVVWTAEAERDLKACLREAAFGSNFEKILELCAENKHEWVNFNWLLKKGNWAEVLNGKLRWKKKEAPKSFADSLGPEYE